MPARITDTIRPFSHLPGESCMLPRSSWSVTAYPTRVELANLNKASEKLFFSVALKGPVEGFTLMQDLERDFVRVFGRAKEGYFSCRLFIEPKGIRLLLERCPEAGITFSFQDETKTLLRKETHLFPLSLEKVVPSYEKMHFGCHKAQDWSLVKRRLNLEEVLPVWFNLGSKCPSTSSHYEGTAQLLQACERHLTNKERTLIGPALMQLFCAGFSGMLIPRLVDTDHQGILARESHPQGSPLVLLSDGARLVRRLFIDESADRIILLPCLPVELHAGYLSHIEMSSALSLDIEWSKKTLRRVIVQADDNQACSFSFGQGLKSFRMRTVKRQQGIRLQKGDLIQLEARQTYIFDRFEK